ncbi:MAG: hypothetical protein JWO59_740 [Chloroflexi bacterium]|nr:hypothetical protein [Chloroflexota bacterium]
MADKRYVNAGSPDGVGGNFMLGMPNKLGYMSFLGPDGKDWQLGLIQTTDVEMDNGLTMDPQAFSNWLEPNPGTPQWSVNLQRSIVRGYSVPQLLKKMYGLGNGVTFDFQWLPFVLTFDYNHAPPTLGGASFYDAHWQYHKVLIRNYRFSPAEGPNRRMGESFTALAAGEDFSENGNQLWTSEKHAYGSDFFQMKAVKAK